MKERLDGIYSRRFPAEERSRVAIWRPIVRYLGRYIDPGSPVLEIACDRGQFINQVDVAERWATDVRDMSATVDDGVRFVAADGLDLLAHLPESHFGTVFMSNYLEHLPSPDAVIRQFEVVARLLRPGGRVVVLQPNIRLVGASYWDFIDHRVALTERSLQEAAELAGLETVSVRARFLPYTTKGRLPSHPLLVSLYLSVRPAWWLLGKQTLYVAARPR